MFCLHTSRQGLRNKASSESPYDFLCVAAFCKFTDSTNLINEGNNIGFDITGRNQCTRPHMLTNRVHFDLIQLCDFLCIQKRNARMPTGMAGTNIFLYPPIIKVQIMQ